MFGVLKLNELLITKKVKGPPWDRDDLAMAEQYRGWCRQQMAFGERFQIQNVADYFYHGTDQEEWDIKQDFPCVAPPYPVFWMEYTQPRLTISKVHGRQERHDGPDVSHGFLCVAHPVDEIQSQRDKADLKKIADYVLEVYGHFLEEAAKKFARLREMGFDYRTEPDPWKSLADRGFTPSEIGAMQALHASRHPDRYYGQVPEIAKGGWSLEITSTSFVAGQPPHVPCYRWLFLISSTGSILESLFTIVMSHHHRGDKEFSKRVIDQNNSANALVFPVLMALTFLNCKNVTVDSVSPDPGLESRWVDRHRKPSFRYKVLHIEPMTRAIRQAREMGTSAPSPLHICRGHFKDYRERGLFGHHRGVFWWDHHIRGDKSNGVVVKDYAVSSPNWSN